MRKIKLRPQSSVLGPFVTSAVLIVFLPLLVGCNVVGALAYKVTPTPKTPAKYKPAKELAVIIVENYRNPSASDVDSEQLARLIADQIREQKTFPLVADEALSGLRDQDLQKFCKMTIPAIGRAVNAKQVIYVDLIKSTIDVSVGESMIRGSMEAMVKVVDATTGQSRWPTESAQGWPVSVQTPFVAVSPNETEITFRRKLQEAMALQVSHLFYDWSNENAGSQFGRD